MPETATWTAFANPAADAGKLAHTLPALQQKMQASGLVETVVLSHSREEMITQVEQALAQGTSRIISIGGDGTAHTIANAILRYQQRTGADVSLAVYPAGSGNDWVKSHAIPTNEKDWLKMLAGGKTVLQSAGLLHYQNSDGPQARYFINVAGLAYDGYVVQQTERHPRRRLPSRLYYLLMILRSLWSYRLERARVTWPDGKMEDTFYTINAGIGRYSGGGMQLCPHADPTADTLAVTTAGNLSKIGVLLNSWRFYTTRIGEHPKVNCWHSKTFTVTSLDQQPILLEADGEFLGHGPVQIEVIPACLRVLVP